MNFLPKTEAARLTPDYFVKHQGQTVPLVKASDMNDVELELLRVNEVLNWLEEHPEIQILKELHSGKVSLIWPFHKTFISGAPNLRVAVAQAIAKENEQKS